MKIKILYINNEHWQTELSIMYKTCSRFIIEITNKITEPKFEKIQSVRLDTHRCGPEGKLFVDLFNFVIMQ